MKGIVKGALAVQVLLVGTQPNLAHGQQAPREALARYDRAFRTQDVETIHSLLAEDVLLYEHSVRNDGREDVFENHLKPEILEFEDMKLELSDVRVTAGTDLALVTRGYALEGNYRGRAINVSGNETMVWKKIGAAWKVAHIHYSHPCPSPPEARDEKMER